MQKDIRPCYGEELQKLIALNKKFDSGNVFGASQGATINSSRNSKKVDENTFPVISRLSKLLKLLMLIPATAGTVERAQFSLKFVKNNLPPAISEDRMNVLILLYIHKI